MTIVDNAKNPSQEEIDNVAHFVEAIHQLKISPFFIEEFNNLSISTHKDASKDDIKGYFPDPNVVAAVIVPFRRVWQQTEPCHYRAVVNIIKKYLPQMRSILDRFLSYEEKSSVKVIPYYRNINLSLSDAIDMWLNTKYLHIGKSSRNGRFSRKDFETYNRQIGSVLFEYFFLTAIREVGICFFNILQLGEYFLKYFAKYDLVPSFSVQRNIESKNIERKTPGFTPEIDSPEQRVWRLRRRRQYNGISEFFDHVNCSDQIVAEFLNKCSIFDEFVSLLSIQIDYIPDFTTVQDNVIVFFGGCLDDEHMANKNQKMRRGFIAKLQDGSFVWTEDYVPILRDQYLNFREAVMSKHFK